MRSSASSRGGSRSRRTSQNGIPAFVIVGLADRACQEAKQRVRSGITVGRARVAHAAASPSTSRRRSSARRARASTCRSRSPCSPRRGSCRPSASTDHAAVGELALDGRLRRVGGVLAVAEGARRAGLERLLCPPESGAEAALAGIEPIPVPAPRRRGRLPARRAQPRPTPPPRRARSHAPPPDLADVRGQERARRALELAAAGAHNLLLAGPPGTGQDDARAPTARASCRRSTPEAALEVTRIHSVAGLLSPERPLSSSRRSARRTTARRPRRSSAAARHRARARPASRTTASCCSTSCRSSRGRRSRRCASRSRTATSRSRARRARASSRRASSSSRR